MKEPTNTAQRGKSNRRRGLDAERELVRLLRENLGDDVTRNLRQPRDGGADLENLPYVLEVKRSATPKVGAWWRQVTAEALACGGVPCLAYRIDRQEWRFVLPLGMVHQAFDITHTDLMVTMGIQEFVAITLERISEETLKDPVEFAQRNGMLL